jgi:dTDP-4-amino-4,6-dideoxygalactose transaminase
MHNPYAVVDELEAAISDYTAAPYVVTTNSCTMAILLACKCILKDFEDVPEKHLIEIPKRTYVSVPMSIIHAGGKPVFRDQDWSGYYQLKPLPVFDCARWFSSNMYYKITPDRPTGILMVCVSFHASKILGDTQGGAILLNDKKAYEWLLKARFDGRTKGVPPHRDTFDTIGWHCYMSPDVAARLLLKLSVLPDHNIPLPNDKYPDLSLLEIFK